MCVFIYVYTCVSCIFSNMNLCKCVLYIVCIFIYVYMCVLYIFKCVVCALWWVFSSCNFFLMHSRGISYHLWKLLRQQRSRKNFGWGPQPLWLLIPHPILSNVIFSTRIFPEVHGRGWTTHCPYYHPNYDLICSYLPENIHQGPPQVPKEEWCWDLGFPCLLATLCIWDPTIARDHIASNTPQVFPMQLDFRSWTWQDFGFSPNWKYLTPIISVSSIYRIILTKWTYS